MCIRYASLFALGSLLLFTACREAKVTSYRVPKEESTQPVPSATEGSDMASTAVPTAHGEGLSWSAPTSWETMAPTSMRKGSYLIKGPDGATADLSITAFPGDVGGDLANINRWRGQIKLEPITAESLSSQVTSINAQGLTLKSIEMANLEIPEPQRVLGAIVGFEGNTWFFKLTGPEALVANEKSSFIAFLETIEGHSH